MLCSKATLPILEVPEAITVRFLIRRTLAVRVHGLQWHFCWGHLPTCQSIAVPLCTIATHTTWIPQHFHPGQMTSIYQNLSLHVQNAAITSKLLQRTRPGQLLPEFLNCGSLRLCLRPTHSRLSFPSHTMVLSNLTQVCASCPSLTRWAARGSLHPLVMIARDTAPGGMLLHIYLCSVTVNVGEEICQSMCCGRGSNRCR